MMRQLITLNTRSKEHSKYLHNITMYLNELKDKHNLNDLHASTSSYRNSEYENIYYEMLPISNDSSLNSLKLALINGRPI